MAAITLMVVMLRDIAAAARDLRDEAGRFSELRPAVVSLKSEIERSRAAVTRLRDRQ